MSVGARKGIDGRWEEMSMGNGRDRASALVAVLGGKAAELDCGWRTGDR